jgi:putative resolvase
MRLLRPKEAAEILGITTKTLRNLDNKEKLHPVRTEGGHRRFDEKEIKNMTKIKSNQKIILYARVSTYNQKEDLNKQIELLKIKYPYGEVYFDIRSGLKFNRKGFLQILGEVEKGNVYKVVIVYKDRLARFGFDLIKRVFEGYGVEIEVMNEMESLSLQEELVKDLISIVTSFSARLYGLRSHKTKKIISEIKGDNKIETILLI